MLSQAAGNVLSAGTSITIVFVLSLFLLASGTMFYEKIVQSFSSLSEKKRALRVVYDVEREISHYLLTVTVINAGLGTIIGLGLWALGVPNAQVWGAAAALLNFLPYIGALITITLVTVIALISFETISYALLAPAFVILCDVIEGQFVTPTVVGRRLEINAVAILIAIAFSVFQIYIAAYGSLPSQVVRAMHVGFLLLLGFGLIANLRATSIPAKAVFWTLGLLGFATGLYNWVFYADLIRRSGFPTTPDLIVGTMLVVLVFEAARRLMGLPLALIALIFLAYASFGNYLPPPFIHRGYDFAQLIDTFAFGTEGIYGTPVYVSAAYIFIFVVFAAFLERAGMIALFNDFALGLVGTWRGGPAQVCVLSSALMGTISGSGVANVVASGQFTIPLMKRTGLSGVKAGAIEASASINGQIMPPVMGAAAFLMVEYVGIPYSEIVKHALLPAVFSYIALLYMVHLEAIKMGLKTIPQRPTPARERMLRMGLGLSGSVLAVCIVYYGIVAIQA
ncbi:MAG: TRAP transporter fused permease subunit, partial [Mesorhizobium sp.]